MEQGTIYDISPITKIKTIVYNKMEIKVLRINFGSNSAELEVKVYDEMRESEKIFTYLVSGPDYLNWSTDSYICNYVKHKLTNENF
jgi:hypothetical protein